LEIAVTRGDKGLCPLGLKIIRDGAGFVVFTCRQRMTRGYREIFESVLAKMVMAAYARHDDMSILVVDPQGEYGREVTNNGQLKGILSQLKRTASVFDISRVALADLDSLKRILIVSGFVDVLGVRAEENRLYAAEVIGDFFARVHTIPTATGTPIHVSLSAAGERSFPVWAT